jgi:hypothetical protein
MALVGRQRWRSRDEQAYWARLSPRERVAFLLGFTVGQGHPFPNAQTVRHIREQMGVARPKTTPGKPRPTTCSTCGGPLPPHVPGTKGRPRTRCTTCRPTRARHV